jgi:hypothetical protein
MVSKFSPVVPLIADVRISKNLSGHDRGRALMPKIELGSLILNLRH